MIKKEVNRIKKRKNIKKRRINLDQEVGRGLGQGAKAPKEIDILQLNLGISSHYLSRSKKKKSKKHKKSRERSKERSKERPKRKSTSPRDKHSRNKESISKETNNNSNFQLKDESKLSKIVNKNPDIPISHSDPAKIKRELYITNFPEGLIPSQVTELMNTAMVAINANIKSGNPIVSTWINPESNYAILEFRTEEEANNAFKLDGISILGKSIKIGRPQNPGEENIHQQISKR